MAIGRPSADGFQELAAERVPLLGGERRTESVDTFAEIAECALVLVAETRGDFAGAEIAEAVAKAIERLKLRLDEQPKARGPEQHRRSHRGAERDGRVGTRCAR